MGIVNSTSLGKLISLIICIAICSACSNTEELILEPDLLGLYALDKSEIDDWDEGFIYYNSESSSNSIYILSKELNSERFIYINSLDNITKDGISVSINQRGQISNIIFNNTMFNVSYQDHSIVLSSFENVSENTIIVPITNHRVVSISSRSSSNWWSSAEFVTNLIDIFQNGGALVNGDYAKLLIALSTDQLISILKLGAKGNVLTWIGIELANRAFFAAAKEILYHGSMPILSQERENNKITLKISPNSIDPNERVYIGLSILVNNRIDQGIYKIPSYTIYDKRSNLIEVKPGISEYKFDIDFSELGHYEIRPFLISHSIIQDYDTEFVREWFVQYGEQQEYSFPDIHVLSVQKKFCAAISEDEVAFRIECNVFIEEPHLVDKIGIRIVNSDYEIGRFSIVPSDNNKVRITAQGKIEYNNFNELNKTKLMISPYVESKDDVIFGKYYEYIISLSDCPDSNHPHLIDLGLPSGKKWACCNVGCKDPEHSGGYFAFAEISEKSVYSWETYFDPNCTISKSISGNPQYDAATHLMGSNYRIPTMTEAKELINNCIFEVCTLGSTKGVLATGANGNKIFIPFAGSKINSILENYGGVGEYWLADGLTQIVTHPFYMFFNNEDKMFNCLNGYGRRSGKTIRAISK